MGQEGKTSGDGKVSPFGNHNGATSSGPSKGGHDFVKDPEASNSSASGIRDFVTLSRPQSEAKPEVEPSKGEAAPGGLVPHAEPGPASKAVADDGGGVKGEVPFKSMR